MLVGWLVEFYVHATSKVISGQATTCGNQAANTITRYRTQSYYPDTELTSSCPILLMWCTRPGSDKGQFDKSLV